MSWIKSVADYLQAQSYGVQGTSLFVGDFPDISTLSITLNEYSGNIVETQKSGIALFKPMLQVKVRGSAEDYSTPRETLLAIQNALASLSDQTLYGTHFLHFKPTTTILALGQDSNLRFSFTANFEVTYA